MATIFLYPLENFRPGQYRHGTWTFYGTRHSGVDDLPPIPGQKVEARSPEDGVVINSDVAGACGNRIVIKGDSGFTHYMCHFNIRYVRRGQRVKMGQTIGRIGTTGLSNAVHLHRVLIAPDGLRVDPDAYQWTKEVRKKNIKTKIDYAGLFEDIWGVKPAYGDWKYFEVRRKNGSIPNDTDLIKTIKYWYGVVYPWNWLKLRHEFSEKGNRRWQYEKEKWL